MKLAKIMRVHNLVRVVVVSAVAFTGLFWLIGCETVSLERPDEIVKSPNDKQEYQYLELTNGIKVVLVHKSDTDRAAVSIVVATGSDHDPEDVPGMAHYLEHMLFLGSEKYPEPEGFTGYVEKHGGSYNAYTASDHTAYFFEIDPEYLDEGLDRLGQFFIAPLMDETYVEREKNAVHSEYQMNLRSDSWRGFTVEKLLMHPDYPGARFNIGSNETLKSVTRDQVLDFYTKHYSADQMTIALVDQRPLEELEMLVKAIFEGVANRELGESEPYPPIYDIEQLPQSLAYKTIQSNRTMKLSFPIPSSRPYYKFAPTKFISYMLGHEGNGSLHALLNERGWINSLNAGATVVDPTNGLFEVSIGLTELGWQHLGEIRSLVFRYIDAMEVSELEEWRQTERAQMDALNFRFQEAGSAQSTAMDLATGLLYYPPRDLLTKDYIQPHFDEALIHRFLGYLQPSNCLTVLSAPDIEGEQTEPWFDVEYTIGPDIDLAHESTHVFTLPQRNPYIPSDTTLISSETLSDPPNKIVNEPGFVTWHAADTEFGVPRANVTLRIHYADGISSPADRINTLLLARLINDQMNTTSYVAARAGLTTNSYRTRTGMAFGAAGYNDNLDLLFHRLLDTFINLQVDEQKFETFKSEMAKDLRDFREDMPYQQAFSMLNITLQSHLWHPDEQLQVLEDTDLDAFEQWRQSRSKGYSAEMLIIGNFSMSDAQVLSDEIRAKLNVDPTEMVLPQVVNIDNDYRLNLKIPHTDAVYLSYFQADEETLEERAKVDLLASMFRANFFASLRTEQQMGYAVFGGASRVVNRPDIWFLVQSPSHTLPAIHDATRQFIMDQIESFENMPEDEFQEYVSGQLNTLRETDKSLGERAQRYLDNLNDQIYTFDVYERLASITEKLTLPEMSELFTELTDIEANNHLLLYSMGKTEEILLGGKELANSSSLKEVAGQLR